MMNYKSKEMTFVRKCMRGRLNDLPYPSLSNPQDMKETSTCNQWQALPTATSILSSN